MKCFCTLLLVILNLNSLICNSSEEQKPPKLELGIGFFAFRLNHYRGSNQYRNLFFPLPYFSYRGKIIKAKNSMIQGKLYRLGDFSLGASFMGSLRVSSTRNEARQGMPPLDTTFEIGPEARYNLLYDQDKKNILSIHLPLRSAFACNFFWIKHIGYFAVPYVAFTSFPQKYTLNLFSSFSVATMWASKKYHNYFYKVSPTYARPGRRAYESKSGYSGSHLTWFISKKVKALYLYSFVRYDYLNKAVFDDSPLVKQKHYWVFGGGIIFYFYQSKEKGHQ